MFRPLLIALALLALAAQPRAQVEFTSSDLPIIFVKTDERIPDEPKIQGRMRIVDNGAGQRNHVTDEPTDYDGAIGIEIRGTTSQFFDKKQYGVETRDEDGENLNVSLLGFPEENDWILHAPYSDKSLMRNVLAYHLARSTGRYASRTRYCELVLNGEYMGVYVLLEKVKRDHNRVDINKLKPDETEGDDLTGGYIFQIDRFGDGGWFSSYPSGIPGALDVYFEYNTPDDDEIVPEQSAYIQDLVRGFEGAMDADSFEDPEAGYPVYINLASFVDFVAVSEVSRNVDAYRLSTYLHKDKDSNDPLLHAGPVWDFNIAFGNANFYRGSSTQGFQYDLRVSADENPVPFWWKKLAQSKRFSDSLAVRWQHLRREAFHTDSLLQFIDETAAILDEAQARNFERWPVLGTYVWPNAYVGSTYEQEVGYLKTWVTNRVQWLDGQFAVAAEPSSSPLAGFAISRARPNPARGLTRIGMEVETPQVVTVALYDVQGRRVATLHDGPLASGIERTVGIATDGLASGVYRLHVLGETFQDSHSIAVIGR